MKVIKMNLNETEIKVGQTWQPKGRNSKWEIWYIKNNIISLTRTDIPNRGFGDDRYEKFITKKNLLKRYNKI